MGDPKRLALIGGTFDPVHGGHIGIARAAQETLDLDQVRFLPCRQSPHKQDRASSASTHRLAMLRLATQGLSWAKVDAFELHQDLPSYSWRTAEAFRQRYPHSKLYWIMGTDQWQALERWANWERLAELVHFIVFQRGEFPRARNNIEATFIEGQFDISATEIREGDRDSSLSLPSVDRYIRDHGLYQ